MNVPKVAVTNAPVAATGSLPLRAPQGVLRGAAFASLVRRGAREGEAARATPRSVSRVREQHGNSQGRPSAQARTAGAPAHDAKGGRRSHADEDALDPLHRQQAALAPPELTPQAAPQLVAARFDVSPATDATVAAHARVSMEELLSALVRRIAWSGDGRRGTVRIELGAGGLAGGVLVIHADDGRVRIQLSAPSGVDAAAWSDRIRPRLAARKIDVEHVEIT